jgi:hypothetical protein
MRPLLPLLALLMLTACPTPVDDDDTLPTDDDDATVDDDDATGDDDDATDPLEGIDEVVARLEAATTAADADAVMHELAWSGGLPYAEGLRLLFVTRWDDGYDGVSLVSDLNGWEPGIWPASRSAAGSHYWVVVDKGATRVPYGGATYKWHAPDDVWRAPPEATAYDYDEFGERGYVAPPPDVPWLERFPDFIGATLENPRTWRARLPAGFVPASPAAASMRTLLMHDGQNLFDPEAFWGGWQVGAALDDNGWDDVVVLAVDSGADRLDVYSHVSDDIHGDGEFIGGRADDYLAQLRDETLPFFRSRYGIVGDGDSLMVAGSSMGGLISLYMAMTQDGQQACIAAMSSTLGWGAFAASAPGDQALARLWPSSWAHGTTAIYLDSGGAEGGGCVDVDGDGIVEDSEDSDNYCVGVQMRDVLEGLGYTFEQDLWHWHEPFAAHNEAAWAARLPLALEVCDASGWVAP